MATSAGEFFPALPTLTHIARVWVEDQDIEDLSERAAGLSIRMMLVLL